MLMLRFGRFSTTLAASRTTMSAGHYDTRESGFLLSAGPAIAAPTAYAGPLRARIYAAGTHLLRSARLWRRWPPARSRFRPRCPDGVGGSLSPGRLSQQSCDCRSDGLDWRIADASPRRCGKLASVCRQHKAASMATRAVAATGGRQGTLAADVAVELDGRRRNATGNRR